MSNKIILSFQPFDLRQNIIVVNEQGKTLYQTTADSNVENIMATIKSLAIEFQVIDVIMHGNKRILQQYATTLKTKYGFENLNVVIM